MYLVEKLGELVLVTLEGQVTDDEIQAVKKQLGDVAEYQDEVVVSFYQNKADGTVRPMKEENRHQEIVDFCIQHNIRIYSYLSES